MAKTKLEIEKEVKVEKIEKICTISANQEIRDLQMKINELIDLVKLK
jgi:hypothetical protein